MNWRTIASSTQRAAKAQVTHIVVIFIFVVLVVVAFAISVLGYVLRLEWTGVTERTFWHWLELLVAPVLLSGGGFLLYAAWAWSDHRLMEKDVQEAAKDAQEAARQADLDRITKGYLDDIEQILLKADLKEEKLKIVCAIARARTLNVLEGLDAYRKGSIIRFLHTASLLRQPNSSKQAASPQFFVRLKGANLREAHLLRADLNHANLSGADLSYANLDGAILLGADLSEADLGDAKLSDAKLGDAQLGGAKLSGANLHLAKLNRAKLRGAKLNDAYLRRADLNEADLREADLFEVDLSRATLSGADLSGANLKNASLENALGVTDDQLADAASLEGATMPDGQKYENWLKNKGRREDGENSAPS